MKSVSKLTKKQESVLWKLLETSKNHRVRMRAHCILLSSKGYSIKMIIDIYQLNRDTLSSLIDRWEQFGISGLSDKPRSGRPPILSKEEVEKVLELIKEYSQSIRTVISKLFKITGKIVSPKTIRRLAKSANLTWKRIRKSLKSKRNQKEFEKAKVEIEELEKQQDDDQLKLFYFDESGFSLEPSIPYAWQPIGEAIALPSSKSLRINVLGFLNTDMIFQSFMFKCSITSSVVEACFDYFSNIITGKTIVIIDNATTHSSIQFTSNLKKWEYRGLFLKYLPPYSPELNKIEILWRFIKYHWLPLNAYNSFKNLEEELGNVLRNVGKDYKICFSENF